MKKLLTLTMLTLALIACGRALPPALDTTGTWTGKVTVDDLTADFRLILQQQENNLTGRLESLDEANQHVGDVYGLIQGNEGVLNVQVRRGDMAGSTWRFIGAFTGTSYGGIIVVPDRHSGRLDGRAFDGTFGFAR